MRVIPDAAVHHIATRPGGFRHAYTDHCWRGQRRRSPLRQPHGPRFRVSAAGVDHRARSGRPRESRYAAELTGGHGQSEYRAGQIGYWPPGDDLALYYHEDGFRIPSPGIVMIGEIDSGLETIIGASDNDTLTITAADDPPNTH